MDVDQRKKFSATETWPKMVKFISNDIFTITSFNLVKPFSSPLHLNPICTKGVRSCGSAGAMLLLFPVASAGVTAKMFSFSCLHHSVTHLGLSEGPLPVLQRRLIGTDCSGMPL